MLEQDIHLGSVQYVKEHLKEEHGVDVKDWVVREIMKKDLNLRYKRINKISW